MRLAAALLCAGAARAAPDITTAGWSPTSDPSCPGGAPCVELTIVGNGFGATPGVVQRGDFLAPAPPPPPQPWDTPAPLFPSDLATRAGGNGVCVARSLYTGDGSAYRFCPFSNVEWWSQSPLFLRGSLGTYAGVIRDANNANCPGSNAIVGMTFLDGSICGNASEPATAVVNFVCVDVLGEGLVDWGTRTPMIHEASAPDGCAHTLTLPLPAACDGPRFGLCGSAAASPNPVPSPSPIVSYEPAQVATWADTLVTALMPGTLPPPAVRILTAASDLSGAMEPEGPEPLPPSATPVPVPFPPGLQIVGMSPQQGVRGECTPVWVAFAGVTDEDVTGSGFQHIFRMRLPTSETGAQLVRMLGLPQSVDGAQVRAPPNGLLNLSIPCLSAAGNWPSYPHTVTPTGVGSYWTQASLGTYLIRGATCITPGCVSWTFLPPPGVTQSDTASISATAPPPSPSETASHSAGASASDTATVSGTAPVTPSASPTPFSGASPVVYGAGWAPQDPATTPCPAGLPWDCALPRLEVEVAGARFGAAAGPRGGVQVAAAAAGRAPAPPPADAPDALLALGALTGSGGTRGCLAPSRGASAVFDFEVCPFGEAFLLPRWGGPSAPPPPPRLASLGAFAGVLRSPLPLAACNDSGTPAPAITALLFAGGDLCDGAPRSATVNLVCIDAVDPFQGDYTAAPAIWGASPVGGGGDGCAWSLDLPLVAACAGASFGLCGAPAPAPNPAPLQPPPSPAFTDAFVTAWADGHISALVPAAAVGSGALGGAAATAPLPSLGPPTVVVQRADGARSAAQAAAGRPGPLTPSGTPAPAPFPTALTLLALSPPGVAAGSNCTPVSVQLAGVTAADFAGVEPSFDIAFPLVGSGLASRAFELRGAPAGASGAPPVLPASGLLTLWLDCAPQLLDNTPLPHAAAVAVRSRARVGAAMVTTRAAACAGAGGGGGSACTWTFLPAGGGGGGPPAPAAAHWASPAVVWGSVGGGAVGLLVFGGLAVALMLRARRSSSGSSSAAYAAPPSASAASGSAKPVAAWEAVTVVVPNPLASGSCVELRGAAPAAGTGDPGSVLLPLPRL